MPDDSNRSHEAREESHASLMDDMGDEFVLNIDDFDIPAGPGVDDAAYFQNLNFALHHIFRVIPRVQPTPLAPPLSVAPQETPIERFYKCKVENFYGTSKDDPIAAGQWLRVTLWTLQSLHFTPEGNLECIISLLKGDAYDCPKLVASESIRCRRFHEGLYIDIDTYLAADPPEVFLELVRQAKAIERVLSIRLSSSNESSIQSKRACPSQIAAKRIRDSRGFRRAPSTQSQRLGQGSGPGAHRIPLTSSSLASSGGSVRSLTFSVCNFCGRRHPMECYWRIRACFQCGSTEHFVKDYPKASGASPAQT
ncbi:hypothetical protein GOBAR_AA03454 [Gossypium barbadense]|uniref:CCHC-type domain-containing protein n=1 Tax=Gossypium barbadense TaxID=3634 RepID=A0A2P5YNG0_GOSBA|nr:hypothetical protein GOBAR_AA03454 [Gossypium barbadense]